MAVIGEMKKLTIGNKTYTIPSGSLVTVTRSLTSGTKSATISIDETSYDIYSVTNTDEKVKQSNNTTSNANLRILFSQSAIDTDQTSTVYKSENFYYNPSTKALTTGGAINGYTLAAASAKAVDTSISAGSSSVNLPTSAAVASFVEGKGYITSYTDENLKWTASTSTNTYYPLQSTSTATTSTANTLNGISFYQYYNTAGGYRRLDLGNVTAYKTAGGAYGTIRLYGAAATYYGDLVPGVLGTTSGDGHISANRTWTLPDKTGTIALTSDIPTISYPVTSVNTKTGAVTLTASDVGALPSSTTIPSITLNGTATTSPSFYAPTDAGTSGYVLKSNGSGAPTWTSAVLTDTKVSTAAVTSGTTYYPVVGSDTTSAATKYYDKTGFIYKGTNGTTSAVGGAELTLGNSTASGTANNKQGKLILYGSTAYAHTISGAPTAARAITLPDKAGTIALTSDIPTIPTVPTITLNGSSTTSPSFYAPTEAGTSGYVLQSGGSGAPTWVSAVLTDQKVSISAVTNGVAYYPIVATNSTTAAARQYDATGFSYSGYNGTAGSSVDGYSILTLGNSTPYTSANWKQGGIRLYGTSAYYIELVTSSPTSNKTIFFPDKAGTIALTSDIPTIPTIPTITLNGTATTSPGFYAPTGAGTSGQYLKSSGSGAPTWTNFPTIPSITLNGSGSTSPSFYAPTGAGTSGYVLKSNGSGAPTWTSAVLTDVNVTSTAVTAATTNYIVGSTTSTTTTGGLSKHASGVLYTTADTATSGYTQLRLGNTTATTTAGGREGQIRLYGTTATYYVDIKGGAPSANRTLTLPNATGTVALTSDIPTVPTITLNGSATTSPSFYAPTGAGTSGQYLKSNGSGAPSWTNFPTIPSITLNGSSTTSPSFYAPTTAGTNGYFLKSNGSGAPTWEAVSTTAAQIIRW